MTAESAIADGVAEMHAKVATEPPNEVMGAFGREQAELAAEGAPAGVAAPGTPLADAKLLDAHGAPTSLHAAAMPTVAILDADHVLRWIDVHPDYSIRTEPAQVISDLDQLTRLANRHTDAKGTKREDSTR